MFSFVVGVVASGVAIVVNIAIVDGVTVAQCFETIDNSWYTVQYIVSIGSKLRKSIFHKRYYRNMKFVGRGIPTSNK